MAPASLVALRLLAPLLPLPFGAAVPAVDAFLLRAVAAAAA